MIPNETLVLDITQEHLDGNERSCFTCLHWQLRDRGETIVCTERPLTSILTEAVTRADGDLAVRRADRCRTYEDED